MSYAQVMTEDRRLVLLRALDGSPSRESNNFVLQTVCEGMGHRVGRDVILADLAWLEQLGLLHQHVLASAGGPITIARLTTQGVDVAQGRTVIPGIKRPLPGE